MATTCTLPKLPGLYPNLEKALPNQGSLLEETRPFREPNRRCHSMADPPIYMYIFKGLLCRNVGLLCRNIGLFWGNIGLVCRCRPIADPSIFTYIFYRALSKGDWIGQRMRKREQQSESESESESKSESARARARSPSRSQEHPPAEK